MSYSTAGEPVAEGTDLSGAPLDTPAPETGEQPEAGLEVTGTVTESGTEEPPAPATPGIVTLATMPPMGTLTIPADGDGEPVVIGRDGTEVDEVTAERARLAAAAAGLRLRES